MGGLLDLVWAGKLLTMFEICGYLYEGNFGCSSAEVCVLTSKKLLKNRQSYK